MSKAIRKFPGIGKADIQRYFSKAVVSSQALSFSIRGMTNKFHLWRGLFIAYENISTYNSRFFCIVLNKTGIF
ncbi:hypothetical protein AT05_06980 [Schleiferia thermophila str. Yellowstone]|nr:hypothetical protein AT05_06980 [Schleiferia thermophila str. Yellowstone]